MTTLREWLAREPFGLAMSSGFFGFYAHTGMLLALRDAGFAPASIAGSSAGALVGGAYAAGVEPEALATILRGLDRGAFWDPRLGAGLLAGNKFDALLRAMLPVGAIEACRIPTRISVFDIAARATCVLERGDLSDAIRASCAVPVMFHPVTIAGRRYWDGGIKDRPGIAGVPAGERLLFHHLAGNVLPRRANMTTLVIEGLPQPHPFRLDAGRRSIELARDATERALDREIVSDVVAQRAAGSSARAPSA